MKRVDVYRSRAGFIILILAIWYSFSRDFRLLFALVFASLTYGALIFYGIKIYGKQIKCEDLNEFMGYKLNKP